MLILRYPYLKNVFWHIQIKIRLKNQIKIGLKNHEAGQRLNTRRWFLLDYSLPHYQIGSWAIVFPSSFMINFRIVYIWPIYQSLDKRIWFTILFQENLQWIILSQLELSRTELPKCTPSILMENCDHTICPVLSILFYDTVCKAWLFEKFIFELEASYSFIITCILVRRVISLGKIGVAISKIYCLVSWSPICTLLTLYQH